MKRIKEMLIVFMFIISVSAVVAPQGHSLSDIISGTSSLTLGGLFTTSAGMNTDTITVTGLTKTSTLQVDGNAKTSTLQVDGSASIGGVLDMKNNRITMLTAPTADTDAATKKYVDDKIGTIENPKWIKTSNYLYYTDTNVGIGTTTPTAKLEIKSEIGGIGAVIDTKSQTEDWKYGLIVKATRDNTKAIAVIDGTTNKMVIYGSGKIEFPAANLYISEPLQCASVSNDCTNSIDLGEHSFCAINAIEEAGNGEYYCVVNYDLTNNKWKLESHVKSYSLNLALIICRAYCI